MAVPYDQKSGWAYPQRVCVEHPPWWAIIEGEQSKERIGLRELLSPKVEFVFKQIFGTEDHQNILLNFLNAVFEDAANH